MKQMIELLRICPGRYLIIGLLLHITRMCPQGVKLLFLLFFYLKKVGMENWYYLKYYVKFD